MLAVVFIAAVAAMLGVECWWDARERHKIERVRDDALVRANKATADAVFWEAEARTERFRRARAQAEWGKWETRALLAERAMRYDPTAVELSALWADIMTLPVVDQRNAGGPT